MRNIWRYRRLLRSLPFKAKVAYVLVELTYPLNSHWPNRYREWLVRWRWDF